MTRVPPKTRHGTQLIAPLVTPPVQGPWHAGPGSVACRSRVRGMEVQGPTLSFGSRPRPRADVGTEYLKTPFSRPIRCMDRSGALKFIPRRAWLGMEWQDKSPRSRPPASAQYRPFE